jgi:hypothetical protein
MLGIGAVSKAKAVHLNSLHKVCFSLHLLRVVYDLTKINVSSAGELLSSFYI